MRSYGQNGISSGRVFTGRSASGTAKLSDGGSEEDILPMHGTSRPDRAIMKQTSYVVEYDVEKQDKNRLSTRSSGGRL